MSIRDTWTTRDGRKIPFTEMSDEHLRNALMFLRRAHLRYVTFLIENPPSGFQGELAREAAEAEWLEASTAPLEEIYPQAEGLLREIRRRKGAAATPGT